MIGRGGLRRVVLVAVMSTGARGTGESAAVRHARRRLAEAAAIAHTGLDDGGGGVGGGTRFAAHGAVASDAARGAP